MQGLGQELYRGLARSALYAPLEVANGPDADARLLSELFLRQSARTAVPAEDLTEGTGGRIIWYRFHCRLPFRHDADRFADLGADTAWSPSTSWFIVGIEAVGFNDTPTEPPPSQARRRCMT